MDLKSSRRLRIRKPQVAAEHVCVFAVSKSSSVFRRLGNLTDPSLVRFLSRREAGEEFLLEHLRFTRNDGVFATFIKAVFTNVPLASRSALPLDGDAFNTSCRLVDGLRLGHRLPLNLNFLTTH